LQEEISIIEQDITSQSQGKDPWTTAKINHSHPPHVQAKQIDMTKNQYSFLQVFDIDSEAENENTAHAKINTSNITIARNSKEKLVTFAETITKIITMIAAQS
jgi:hypothetical protein